MSVSLLLVALSRTGQRIPPREVATWTRCVLTLPPFMCPTVILSVAETLAPTVRALPLRPATCLSTLRLTGFSTYLVSFPVFPSLVLLVGGSAALIPHHLSINGPSLPPPPTPPKSTYRSSCLLLAALLFPFLSLFDHTSAAFSASIRSIHPSVHHYLPPQKVDPHYFQRNEFKVRRAIRTMGC